MQSHEETISDYKKYGATRPLGVKRPPSRTQNKYSKVPKS